MRRIVFYNHTGQVSGAEKMLLMLVAHLPRSVFDSVLLCPQSGPLERRRDRAWHSGLCSPASTLDIRITRCYFFAISGRSWLVEDDKVAPVIVAAGYHSRKHGTGGPLLRPWRPREQEPGSSGTCMTCCRRIHLHWQFECWHTHRRAFAWWAAARLRPERYFRSFGPLILPKSFITAANWSARLRRKGAKRQARGTRHSTRSICGGNCRTGNPAQGTIGVDPCLC